MFHHNFTQSNIDVETNLGQKENEQEINLTQKEVIKAESDKVDQKLFKKSFQFQTLNNDQIKNLVRQQFLKPNASADQLKEEDSEEDESVSEDVDCTAAEINKVQDAINETPVYGNVERVSKEIDDF